MTSRGVVHDNAPHTTRFTVAGNHLAQHGELSLTAIGLATRVQSLPAGAPVDIRSLADRFPEGTARISGALRELEVHGYLRRGKERTAGGRIVTRTVSCNQPGRTAAGRAGGGVRESPGLLHTAVGVLSGPRRADPRLLVSATEAEHLAPGVVAWPERELSPEAVHTALTSGLPTEPLRRPAALLAHRLTARLPPPPPFRAPTEPVVRHPLRNCDVCDRAYRGPEPVRCVPCGGGRPDGRPLA